MGLIAQYGFGMSLDKAYDSEHERGKDLTDAKALSDALLVMLLYPWSLCLFFYFLLHVFYKKDKARARVHAAAGYNSLSE